MDTVDTDEEAEAVRDRVILRLVAEVLLGDRPEAIRAALRRLVTEAGVEPHRSVVRAARRRLVQLADAQRG